MIQSELDAAAERLCKKLSSVEFHSLPISDYNKRYVGHRTTRLYGVLRRYSFLLGLALKGDEEMPLVIDYGGGWGGIAMVAAEFGAQVLYNDIYDVSCTDSVIIAGSVGLKYDHIVCGDIGDVIRYVQTHRLRCAALVSYDVLEHIYDIPHFLRQLASTPGDNLRVILASGANPHNPRRRKHLMAHQRMRELKGKQPEWGHKERDALRPYLEIRRELIMEPAPELSPDEVQTLAAQTHGLMNTDIYAVVDDYVKTGSITYQPDHPTNTCDPYTGNWAEHLMDTTWLHDHLASAGFDVSVLPGRWMDSPKVLRHVIGKVLNLTMPLLGSRALTIAPYYVLKGRRNYVLKGRRSRA